MSESLAGKLLVASTVSEDPIVNRSVCLLVHDDDESAIGVMLNRPMRPSPEQLLAIFQSPEPESDPEPGPERENDSPGGESESPGGESFGPGDLASGDNPSGDQDETDGRNKTGGDKSQTGGGPRGKHRIRSIRPKASAESPRSESPRSDSPGPGPVRPGTLHFGGPLSGPIVAIHTSSEYAEAETGRGIYVAAQKQHLEDLVRRHPVPYRLIVGHLGWTSDQLREEIANGFWHVLPATAETIFAGEGDLWPRLIRRATAGSVCSWIGTPDVVGAAELN